MISLDMTPKVQATKFKKRELASKDATTICTPMFVAVLFTGSIIQSTHGWKNKCGYAQRDITHAITQIYLHMMMLRQTSQSWQHQLFALSPHSIWSSRWHCEHKAGARGQNAREGTRSQSSTGMEAPNHKTETTQQMDGGYSCGCTTLWKYWMSLHLTLKNSWDGKLCILL